jgi:hypothetical protein
MAGAWAARACGIAVVRIGRPAPLFTLVLHGQARHVDPSVPGTLRAATARDVTRGVRAPCAPGLQQQSAGP